MSSWLDGVPGRLWLRFGAFLVLVFLVLVLVLVLFWFWVLVRAASGSSPRSFSFLCALLFASFIPYLILAPRSLPTRARSPSFFVHFRFLSVSVSVSGSVVIPPPPRVCLLKYPPTPCWSPFTLLFCIANPHPHPTRAQQTNRTYTTQHNTIPLLPSVCLSVFRSHSFPFLFRNGACHPPTLHPPSVSTLLFLFSSRDPNRPTAPPACLPAPRYR